MSLSITPGTNNVGAYINNIDLKNLNETLSLEIKKTLNQFGVIFIKNKIWIQMHIKDLQKILVNQ